VEQAQQDKAVLVVSAYNHLILDPQFTTLVAAAVLEVKVAAQAVRAAMVVVVQAQVAVLVLAMERLIVAVAAAL
jgi:hypothetical protein